MQETLQKIFVMKCIRIVHYQLPGDLLWPAVRQRDEGLQEDEAGGELRWL